MMKFSVDERVIIKADNVLGTVIQTEYKITRINDNEEITKRYYISKDGYYYSKWYEEDELEATYHLPDHVIKEINKLLIDVHLKERNFDIVKQLVKETYS